MRIPSTLFSTNETVVRDTPAILATSWAVERFAMLTRFTNTSYQDYITNLVKKSIPKIFGGVRFGEISGYNRALSVQTKQAASSIRKSSLPYSTIQFTHPML